MLNARKLITPLGFTLIAITSPVMADMPADTGCVPGETVRLSDGNSEAVTAQDDGEIMLTMHGGAGIKVTLTDAQFAALPQYAIATLNEHLDGLNCYEGPLGRDLMAIIGAGGADSVNLTAVNDYWVEMPVSLMMDYDVVFARSVNGEVLSLRDKGPIWVMVPQSDNTELRDPFFSTYMVWQLNRVDLN